MSNSYKRDRERNGRDLFSRGIWGRRLNPLKNRTWNEGKRGPFVARLEGGLEEAWPFRANGVLLEGVGRTGISFVRGRRGRNGFGSRGTNEKKIRLFWEKKIVPFPRRERFFFA